MNFFLHTLTIQIHKISGLENNRKASLSVPFEFLIFHLLRCDFVFFLINSHLESNFVLNCLRLYQMNASYMLREGQGLFLF